MNNFEQQPGAPEVGPSAPEQEHESDRPRIYVASLSDYNAGRLHGRWIDAGQIVDDVHQEITEMLDRSPEPVAEEYAIHDYDGFGPLHLGEYESMDTVARIAEGIVEHGMAFAHWISCIGTDDEEGCELFEDHYAGHWWSVHGYAENLLDELGLEEGLEAVPEVFRPYIRVDVDAFACGIAMEYFVSEGDDGVYLFLPR